MVFRMPATRGSAKISLGIQTAMLKYDAIPDATPPITFWSGFRYNLRLAGMPSNPFFGSMIHNKI